MKSRIQEKYNSEFVPKLMEQFSYKNVNEAPRLDKITLSMGIGQAIENNKRIEAATKDLGTISGQKAVVTKAKKSVAGFKLREGVPIGVFAISGAFPLVPSMARGITPSALRSRWSFRKSILTRSSSSRD